MKFTVPGNPKPKQRPRRGKGGRWYTPSKPEEKRVANHVTFQLPLHFKLLEECRVGMKFYRGDKRHVDGDNMEKLVLDALQGVVWRNDSTIITGAWEKLYDKENPRTEIRVEEL